MHLRILLLAASLATPAFSQGGPLTPPPGAPAPTMKTLDQVEPRIPLVAGSPGVTIAASGQITINQPGSYYLTGQVNISSDAFGIFINSSGVSLDLMGYSIRYNGVGLSQDAIFVGGRNVSIQNGQIISTTSHNGSSFSSGGFDCGVRSNNTFSNVSVSNLSIYGVRGTGILVEGSASVVENSEVHIAGLDGISCPQGMVRNCNLQTIGSIGISAHTVSDCRVNQSVGIGINATIVANSSAISTGSTGILAVQSVSNSHGESSGSSPTAYGIQASNGTVTACQGTTAGGIAIVARIVTSSNATSTGTHGVLSSGISATSVADSYASSNSGGHGITATFSVSNSVGLSNATVAGRHGISASNATVTGSSGTSAGGHGIFALVVSASRGSSTGTGGLSSCGISCYSASDSYGNALATDGGHGILAESSVDSSYGESSNTASNFHGISSAAGTVTGSRGVAAGGHGISASVVNSSRGTSRGTNANGSSGISAITVTDSNGRAETSGGGAGIFATNVTDSNGFAATGARNGIDAQLATNSYGSRGSTQAGFYGINAAQANGCRALNNASIGTKYNMP